MVSFKITVPFDEAYRAFELLKNTFGEQNVTADTGLSNVVDAIDKLDDSMLRVVDTLAQIAGDLQYR